MIYFTTLRYRLHGFIKIPGILTLDHMLYYWVGGGSAVARCFLKLVYYFASPPTDATTPYSYNYMNKGSTLTIV